VSELLIVNDELNSCLMCFIIFL